MVREVYGVSFGTRRVSLRRNGAVLLGAGRVHEQFTVATSRAGVLAAIEALEAVAEFMATQGADSEHDEAAATDKPECHG